MSNPNARVITSICLMTGCLSLYGCSSYVGPGRGADIRLLAAGEKPETQPRANAQGVPQKPTATFPANVAVVRIQEPGYQSMTNKGIGEGRYSVAAARDIEREEDFAQLTRLPFLAKITPLPQSLLPSSLQSDEELRQVAARQGADMILIYTVDTVFGDAKPGADTNADIRITTSISALLLDIPTGYIYTYIEETAHGEETAATLSAPDACDRSRLKIERRAFERLLYEFEEQWLKVVEEYRK